MIRPQIKKGKQHSELLSQLKPGDEVVTSSGIIGKVKSIHEKFISLDLGTTHIKILKDHISALSNTK
jgi:preprotein translocase subunit YajC